MMLSTANIPVGRSNSGDQNITEFPEGVMDPFYGLGNIRWPGHMVTTK